MSSSAPTPPAQPAAPSPKKSRRRGLLFSFGAVLLLVGGTVAVWIQDEPPPDDRDLTDRQVPFLPGPGTTIVEGLIEIGAKLSEESDLSISLGDGTPPPWPPKPFDRSAWDDATRAVDEIQRVFEATGDALETLDEVLARGTTHSNWLENYNDKTPGILEARKIAETLEVRALARRLAGDREGASRDLDRMLTLGEVLGRDHRTVLIGLLVSISIQRTALESLASLRFDGSLAPEVEARLLGRATFFERHPSAVEWPLRNDYVLFSNAIDTLLEATAAEGASVIRQAYDRVFFKPNRTRRIAAEQWRSLIDRSAIPPSARPEPLEPEDRSALDALLHSTLGDSLLGMFLPILEAALVRADQLTVTERAVRLSLALAAIERETGALPPHLLQVSEYLTGENGSALIDPYSGKLFRYDRERRILWSVGEDGIDQHASEDLGTVESMRRFDLADPTWGIPGCS